MAKRTLSFLICIVLIFCLNGCVLNGSSSSPKQEAMNYLFTNPYFSLRLPDSWRYLAIVEQSTGLADRTANILSFYERTSRATYGGHIFSLILWEENADYTDLPQYEFLGVLTDSTGARWHLVIVYPTDVQFEPGAAGIYSQMANAETRILQTLSPARNCSLALNAE